MTRDQLFAEFPPPWRLSSAAPGVVFDAAGREVLTVDSNGERDIDDVVALAELLVDLGNGAEE